MQKVFTTVFALLLAFVVSATAADEKAKAPSKTDGTKTTPALKISSAEPSKAKPEFVIDKPLPATFAELKQEFNEAKKKFSEEQKALVKEYEEAKDDAKKESRKKLESLGERNPTPAYAARFAAFAEAHPKDPNVFDAIYLSLRNNFKPGKENATWGKVLLIVEAKYKDQPEIRRVLRVLARDEDRGIQIVRDVMANHPDRKVRGLAVLALSEGEESAIQMAKMLRDNEKAKEFYEKSQGKEFVEKVIAKGEKAVPELEKYKLLLKEKYADVIPDLSVGKAAPEVIARPLAGGEARLSELRGKVVVLDIWATWCGPCRAMIPHETEMVDRLKSKPFALVSVSADEEKATLQEFLTKTPMPWTHWWNGSEGGILEDWNVRYFPTIYVIDAKGVIRHKDLRGEELEKAVNDLLKDMDGKKSAE